MMTFREFSALSKTLARIAWGTTPRALWKILYNFCWRNYRNMAEFERLYGTDNIRDAVLYAKELKDRYTVLWLAYQYRGRE